MLMIVSMCSFCEKDTGESRVLPVLCHHEDTSLVGAVLVESSINTDVTTHYVILSLVPIAHKNNIFE